MWGGNLGSYTHLPVVQLHWSIAIKAVSSVNYSWLQRSSPASDRIKSRSPVRSHEALWRIKFAIIHSEHDLSPLLFLPPSARPFPVCENESFFFTFNNYANHNPRYLPTIRKYLRLDQQHRRWIVLVLNFFFDTTVVICNDGKILYFFLLCS